MKAAHVSSFISMATPKQKNEILHLMFRDGVLHGNRIEYKISLPFNLLLYNPKDYPKMIVSPEDIKEYKKLANDINFLEVKTLF